MLLFHLLLRDQQFFTLLFLPLLLISILLGHLLSLDSLFKNAMASGVWDYVFLSAQPAYWTIPAIIFAHWLNYGFLIIVLASPWVIHTVSVLQQAFLCMCILILFTANLTLTGAFTSALTASIKENSLLLSLISIPLYVPNLLFSFAAYQATLALDYLSASLLFLLALFFFNIAVLPVSTYFALNNSNI